MLNIVLALGEYTLLDNWKIEKRGDPRQLWRVSLYSWLMEEVKASLLSLRSSSEGIRGVYCVDQAEYSQWACCLSSAESRTGGTGPCLQGEYTVATLSKGVAPLGTS